MARVCILPLAIGARAIYIEGIRRGDQTMTTAEKTNRQIIRNRAASWGDKYRITSDGEVHFYGRMPNTNTWGWWLFAQSVEQAVAFINEDAA
jgi:hypothetical protein